MLSITKLISIALIATATLAPVNAWTWTPKTGPCDCSGWQTTTYECTYGTAKPDDSICIKEGHAKPADQKKQCTKPPSCNTPSSTPPPQQSSTGSNGNNPPPPTQKSSTGSNPPPTQKSSTGSNPPPSHPPSSTGPGGVVGDPQFTGLRGQSYQVHGIAGQIYNLVSSRDLQVNSRFVFLNAGKCPVVNGKRQRNCYSHPGSYLGEIGIKDDQSNKYFFQAGDAKQGFQNVTLNGSPIKVGSSNGNLQFVNTHEIRFHSRQFDFVFQNSDKFINQEIKLNIPIDEIKAHGLLGQTHLDKTYDNKIKYIEGEVSDYVVTENDVFGDNIVFNAYN